MSVAHRAALGHGPQELSNTAWAFALLDGADERLMTAFQREAPVARGVSAACSATPSGVTSVSLP